MGPVGAGLIGTAAMAQYALAFAVQLIVTELPVACSTLAAARVLLIQAFQSPVGGVVCPAPGVSVCDTFVAPTNTLSNTSSLPLSPVSVTVGSLSAAGLVP